MKTFTIELIKTSKVLFFLVIAEWKKLKPEIRNVESYLKFRELIHNLDNGPTTFNPIDNILNPVGLKYLTRLRLELSNLLLGA